MLKSAHFFSAIARSRIGGQRRAVLCFQSGTEAFMASFSAPAAPIKLVIASRESRLAMWQAHHVRDRLVAQYPNTEVVIDGMTTRGDQILDVALSKVGGKGLFVKELESALASGRCDLAVHSLKDVPMTLAPEFTLAAVLTREDARDAMVSPHYRSLAQLPHGARVGTSSLRREAQLRSRFPHLQVLPLRGNLDTRLSKLDRGDFDAIILAAAGLARLGLGHRIAEFLDTEVSLPSAGQGALGIEICAARADLSQWLAFLHDPISAACAHAERAVSRGLGGSCEMPLGAYAVIDSGQISLRALVGRADGSALIHAAAQGTQSSAEALGAQVAQELVEKGALAMLEAR